MKVVEGKMAIVPNDGFILSTAPDFIRERVFGKDSRDFGIVWDEADAAVEVVFWSEASPDWRDHALKVEGRLVVAPFVVPMRLVASIKEGDTITFNGPNHQFVVTACQKESYLRKPFEEVLSQIAVTRY